MAFIYGDKLGQVYAPGYFLAHEECVRVTKTISATGVSSDAYGHKHVKAGTVYSEGEVPAPVGLLYEDVDVTAGDMPGSVVTKGVVYENRLPADISSVKSALVALGFKFVTEPTVERPDDPTGGDGD